MSIKIFNLLVQGLVDQLGISIPKKDYTLFDVVINDVLFYVEYGGEQDRDALYLHCEFGSLPLFFKEETLERLLEYNLANFGDDTAVFVFNKNTNCVMEIFRVPLESLNAYSLMVMIKQISSQAHIWRRSYFLNSVQMKQLMGQGDKFVYKKVDVKAA